MTNPAEWVDYDKESVSQGEDLREDTMENLLEEFKSIYCEQEPNDWVRLRAVRIQEPFEFIRYNFIPKSEAVRAIEILKGYKCGGHKKAVKVLSDLLNLYGSQEKNHPKV